jgi:hypothetical protein
MSIKGYLALKIGSPGTTSVDSGLYSSKESSWAKDVKLNAKTRRIRTLVRGDESMFRVLKAKNNWNSPKSKNNLSSHEKSG